jgi:bacillithiol biosynthesis deacetylase BshB1
MVKIPKRKNETLVRNMDEHVDVLVINAHPDDETRCAGTLAKLTKRGHSLGLVDLTDGEPTNFGSREVRIEEAKRAAKVLGASFRETLQEPNRLLTDSIETRATVAYWVRRLTPKIVITMSEDPIHPDHVQLPKIVESGLFYARLNQWDQYAIPSLTRLQEYPAHMPNRLFFSIGRSTVNQLEISFIVDITETIDKKIEAITCYESQFQRAIKTNPGQIERKYKSRTAYWGSHIDCAYGEPFLSRRMLGIDDPISAILPVRYG